MVLIAYFDVDIFQDLALDGSFQACVLNTLGLHFIGSWAWKQL
jgi:hypothetical protein